MTSPLLTLPDYIGQRSATFRFRLSDGVTGIQKGEITPLRTPPTLSHDTTRTIKRQVALTLGVADTARINVIRDRVDISMILGGTEYHLGRYLFSAQTRSRWTSGILSSVTLLDEMFIVDQDMESGFGASQLASTDIQTLLSPFDFDTDIEATKYSATGSWGSGTSRAKVIMDIALQGAYFSPWFDHDGVFRCIQAFDPADKIPDFDFDTQNSVFRDSIAETDTLLTAPNRFVVVSNATAGLAGQGPAVGIYDVPNSSPHSIMNRGFVIPDVRTIQLTSSSQAQDVARTIGLSQTVFESVTLTTAPDPRHDSYNVVLWQGEKWLELAWSMTLAEGGPMQHTLQKVYS